MDGGRCKEWFNGLQALRGILFLLVFVSHSGAFFKTDGAYGAMAVSAFFVLSGFLGGARGIDGESSLFKQCIASLCRRIRRFWPVYAALLPVAVILNPCGVLDFLKCAFLVQSYFGEAKTAMLLNWPTWFLSSIMLSYLLSPILVRAARSLGRYAPWGLLLLWVAELWWAFVWRGTTATVSDPGYYWVYICPIARLVDFAAGVLLGVGYARRRNPVGASGRMATMCECAAVGLALLSMSCCGRVSVSFVGSAIWLPASVAVVWVFARCEGPVAGCCRSSWLMWLGRRSFELYVVHRMVLLFVAKAAACTMSAWFIALLATCIVAELLATADAVLRSWTIGRSSARSGVMS